MQQGPRIDTYDAFVVRLKEVGFLLFSGENGLFLSLGELTRPEAWHADGPETDPWCWKDLLTERREGVYGRIFGGRQSLISWDWYPTFLAAYRPEHSIEEIYEMGAMDPLTYRMARLFEERPEWARHELTEALGVTGKEKSKFEGALAALQRDMRITVSGQAQRTAWNGAPIGWPSMRYARVDTYASADCLRKAEEMDRREALARIEAHARLLQPDITPRTLKQLFRIK